MELSHPKAWVVLLSVLIITIGTVAAAYIGILPDLDRLNSIEQTQTVVALQQTQIMLDQVTSVGQSSSQLTPEAQATSMINEQTQEHIIDLSNVLGATYWSENLGIVVGRQELNGINFEYGWNIQTTGCGNNVNSIRINTNLTSVIAVHILSQGGNANSNYEGDEIGNIQLTFSDGQQIIEPLVLGYNIRSWTRDDQGSVESITATYVEEAISARGSGGGRQGGFDIITLNIPQEYSSSILSRILVNDTSEQTMEAQFADPCIHIHAITVETS